MKVEVLNERQQHFNGTTYYRNGWGYFIRNCRPLHRVVWEFHNGAIPKGYEIHHIDGDKSNNQIENLQCVTRKAHRRLHAELDKIQGVVHERPMRTVICESCGKEFQSKGSAKLCPQCKKPKVVKPFRPRRFRTCSVCGKVFELTALKRHNDYRTCSPDCRQQAQHRSAKKPKRHNDYRTCSPECGRKLSGGPPRTKKVERVISACLWCGKQFEHLITQHPKFCSRACADTFRALTLRKDIKANQELRICAQCGKPFIAFKSTAKIFCSKECRLKARS